MDTDQHSPLSELRSSLADSGGAPVNAQPSGALSPQQLYRRADASALNFKTTAELAPLDGLVGQERALGALQFGTRIRKSGFNLFVIGSAGTQMLEVVESLLRSTPSDRPAPGDWVYVNNFEEPRRPIAIQLPPG
ncbi:MAG: AAA family ATPase, partial [Bradyrhizobium sp.]|nr:AAA family ATPase [Bradyrhizobium sp.]